MSSCPDVVKRLVERFGDATKAPDYTTRGRSMASTASPTRTSKIVEEATVPTDRMGQDFRSREWRLRDMC